MKATIRGTEIYFDVAGMQLAPLGKDFVERPVLFLLHGGPGGDHLRFKQHSLELQQVAQLVFIDHRGCGRSKKGKSGDYTLKSNIEDIEALRKYLGLEKICILGTSYGGMVAQGYAIRYCKHITKLILVATAPSRNFLTAAKRFVERHGNAIQKKVCENLWHGGFKNETELRHYFKVMDPLYSRRAKRLHKPEYAKPNTRWSFEVLNEGIKNSLRRFNFIPQLHKIDCPTLVLAGQDDWICAADESKIIAKNIRNAKLKIFKNCGHAIAVDKHEEYIRAIQNFLRRGR